MSFQPASPLGAPGEGSIRTPCEHVFVFDARTLTPSQKGGIAETTIVAKAVQLGIPVLRPVLEGMRYDIAFDLGDRFWRVQCKWGSLRDGVVRAHSGGCRFTPASGYVRSTYGPDEVDAIAIYCGDLDAVYVVPIVEVSSKSVVHLRIAPARNNQASLVKWAAQYELGAIAQLEERRHGMAEAVGSSPTSSTPPKAA